MESFWDLVRAVNFMPHGHCFFWLPHILWLNVISDAFIAFAYFTIPLALVTIVRKRRDLHFNSMFYMFAVFIMACGATHIFHIITTWIPIYFVQGLVKTGTAVASVITAVFLFKLIPTIMTIPSNKMLEDANSKLLTLNQNLEKIVEERTQELRAERDAAAQAQRQAMASEQRLQIILENAEMGIWSFDLDRKEIEFSDRAARLFGLGKREKVSYGECLKKIHPEDRHLSLASLESFKEGTEQVGVMLRAFPETNKTRYLEVKGRSLRNSDGSIHRAMGILYDVTDRIRLEEERTRIVASEQAARESSRLKSDFLAMMSHEIRTPINGVIGMSQLLRETPLNKEQTSYLEAITLSADSLMTVINDVLDFSKVEAGKIDFEELDFNLNQLIRDTGKVFQAAAEHKGLHFEAHNEISPDSYFLGDPGRIRQILSNLLGNAIKFTDKGQVRFDVKPIQDEGAKCLIEFTIVDTGIGINKDAIKRLFSPFSQGDSSTTRKFGGTGLGLSISKKLVDLMGGSIGVESSEGQGARFWVRLPLQKGKKALSEVDTFAIPLESQKRSLRILIAEDNLVNQKVALGIVEKMGFKGHIVANGLEAIDALEKLPFDLVLMDCHMPELDGYEATRAIRNSRHVVNSKIPIVAMTANAMKGDREKCQEAGMNDYISKPFKFAHLLSVIEKWT